MGKWRLESTDGFGNRSKRYAKNHPNEVKAIYVNLEKFVHALNNGVPPREIKATFIHRERKGVTAIDQTGCEGSSKETRLYIYTKNSIVYLITIGGKESQDQDINTACQFVDGMRKRP